MTRTQSQREAQLRAHVRPGLTLRPALGVTISHCQMNLSPGDGNLVDSTICFCGGLRSKHTHQRRMRLGPSGWQHHRNLRQRITRLKGEAWAQSPHHLPDALVVSPSLKPAEVLVARAWEDPYAAYSGTTYSCVYCTTCTEQRRASSCLVS